MLGVANFQVIDLIPIGCVLPEATFYSKLVAKTVGPIVPVALLWAWPAFCAITGAVKEKQERSARFAAKLSLLWLELTLASVSTTIIETFVCQQFDGEFFLNAELTLSCDGSKSSKRSLWIVYASLAAGVYPIGQSRVSFCPGRLCSQIRNITLPSPAGVPLLLFCLMYLNRDEIKSVLQVLQDHDDSQPAYARALTGSTTLEEMMLELKAKKRRPSIVARSEKQGWLMTKLDVYKPSAFWIHPVLLILRLSQSSVLALFRQQHMLAACSSCVAIIGVALVQETSPYRRSSE